MRKRGKRRHTNADQFAAFRLLGQAGAAICEQPMDAEQVSSLAVGYHGAVDSIRRGVGTDKDAHTLAGAVNIALVLAEQGIGPECIPIIQRAQNAVMVLIRRGEATGRYVFDGPGLTVLAEFVDIHDQQLGAEACTKALMMAVIREVQRRHARGDVIRATK